MREKTMRAFQIQPYTMCSREECEERIQNNEVSLFETSSSRTASANDEENHGDRNPRRILDPCKAVSKYRRRTATFHVSTTSIRTPTQLHITVQYLTELLINFDSVTDSFLNLVNFVEDRLRAVQVDLTMSQYASKTIQHSIVRIQILILYLLSDCQQYQHAFGRKALQTALSSYWNENASNGSSSNENEDTKRDDEILSLSMLVLLNDQVKELPHREQTTAEVTMDRLIFGITDLYRKHIKLKQPTSNLPKFLRWTMRLISNVYVGHWQVALHMIMSTIDDDDLFVTMVRLCMAPSIRFIQWRALQLYNVALMPRERVSGLELARLLCFSSPKLSLQFAERHGLPVEDNINEEDGSGVVIFKVVPIQPFAKSEIKNTSSQDYESTREMMDYRVLRNDQFRVSDGMRIPSANWMSQFLIVGDQEKS